jgi:hypothetical protein
MLYTLFLRLLVLVLNGHIKRKKIDIFIRILKNNLA